MAITADMNRPVPEADPEDRQTFTWGVIVSLVLHCFMGLVLLGGISGYVTQPGQEPIEVEIVRLPVPEISDPVDEEPAAAVPPPEEEVAEEQPPEPAPELEPPPDPAEEAQAVEDPVTVLQPVEEFAEEDSGPQEIESDPVADPVEDVAEADAPEVETSEPVEEERTAALDTAETEKVPEPEVEEGPETDVETELKTETEAEAETEIEAEIEAESQSETETAADVEPQVETVTETGTEAEAGAEPIEQAALEADADELEAETEAEPGAGTEADIGTEPAPVTEPGAETEIADDFDPLAGPVDETATAESPTPAPKPLVVAEAVIGDIEDSTPDDFGTVGPIVTEATPGRKPARRVARAAPSNAAPTGNVTRPGQVQARELYSRTLLDNERSRTAMRGMPPGQRLNLLCMTELRAQLTAASAVPPELLPSFRGLSGNVLEPRNAAFRSLGRWFDVNFRCVTDSGVTRVERFSFKIGNQIPQSQWLSRGLSGF